MTDFAGLIQRLAQHQVKFILVGGVAATIHGSARLTQDIDVVYARDADNLARIVVALCELRPYLRGAPAGLPFRWDVATLEHGLNFTLTCLAGEIDLLGEIIGGGRYEDLASSSVQVHVFGVECACLDLPTLIRVKRAAGRPKDLESIAELEALNSEFPEDLSAEDGPAS